MIGGVASQWLLIRLFPDAMTILTDRPPMGRRMLAGTLLVRLGIGYVLAWLYAAARFRLRSTPRTAARIGLAVWFLVYVTSVWTMGLLELFPRIVLGALLVWGFFECLLAGLLAGVVHQRLKPEYARY